MPPLSITSNVAATIPLIPMNPSQPKLLIPLRFNPTHHVLRPKISIAKKLTSDNHFFDIQATIFHAELYTSRPTTNNTNIFIFSFSHHFHHIGPSTIVQTQKEQTNVNTQSTLRPTRHLYSALPKIEPLKTLLN